MRSARRREVQRLLECRRVGKLVYLALRLNETLHFDDLQCLGVVAFRGWRTSSIRIGQSRRRPFHGLFVTFRFFVPCHLLESDRDSMLQPASETFAF
jgi:hypothetical protein